MRRRPAPSHIDAGPKATRTSVTEKSPRRASHRHSHSHSDSDSQAVLAADQLGLATVQALVVAHARVPLPSLSGATWWCRHRGTVPATGSARRARCSSTAPVWLAYRVRRPLTDGRGFTAAVSRSADVVAFETMCEVRREDRGAESFERPVVLRRRDGGWRLYLLARPRAASTGGSRRSTPTTLKSCPRVRARGSCPAATSQRSRTRSSSPTTADGRCGWASTRSTCRPRGPDGHPPPHQH